MGMSDELGNVDLNTDYSHLSSETKQRIEREVRRLVEDGRQRATTLLTAKRKELDLVANALVEYEVLNKDEMEKILRGEKLAKIKALPNVPIKLPELLLPPALGGSGSGSGAGTGTGAGGAGGRGGGGPGSPSPSPPPLGGGDGGATL